MSNNENKESKTMMKQSILIISLVTALLATIVALHALDAKTSADTAYYFTRAFILGLFSVSSFFVGLAYPRGAA